MFMWINSQAVRSDLGFEVESTGRFSIEYREGPLKLDIYVENGFVGMKPCVIFSKASFSEACGQAIPPSDRDRMVKNFVDAMEFQGLATVVSD